MEVHVDIYVSSCCYMHVYVVASTVMEVDIVTCMFMFFRYGHGGAAKREETEG